MFFKLYSGMLPFGDKRVTMVLWTALKKLSRAGWLTFKGFVRVRFRITVHMAAISAVIHLILIPETEDGFLFTSGPW